jgi:hypothetical protein
METTGSSETPVTIYHNNGVTFQKTVFFVNTVMRTALNEKTIGDWCEFVLQLIGWLVAYV